MPKMSRAIQHVFSDQTLLARALTHRSAGADNNERLEFLGDSVLNCVVAQALLERFPSRPKANCRACEQTW